MQALSDNDKKYLLQLARKAIRLGIYNQNMDYGKVPDRLKEKRASFVTLYKHGELRGCIGSLYPIEPLYKTVVHNAQSAAFNDIRFSPVNSNEIDELEIEISVLSPMKRLDYKHIADISRFLYTYKYGVYIQIEQYSSTFLPQVWKQLPNVDDFLNALYRKAGLRVKDWKSIKPMLWYYTVDSFSDSDYRI